MSPAPIVPLTRAQDEAELPDADTFSNSVFVRADEPEVEAGDGIAISRTDLLLCAPEPLRLVVLMHWRSRKQDGRPRTAEAIWATLTELGMRGNDEAPVHLDEVRAAVGFLLAQGLIVQGGEL